MNFRKNNKITIWNHLECLKDALTCPFTIESTDDTLLIKLSDTCIIILDGTYIYTNNDNKRYFSRKAILETLDELDKTRD